MNPLGGTKEDVIYRFGVDHQLAHEVIFAHRHPEETPQFHFDIVDAFHSAHPRVNILAFRGGGKSTRTEEGFVLRAAYGRFKYGMILGSSLDRAVDRLTAVKYEIEYNEILNFMFGTLVGSIWNFDEVVLSNGVKLQAFGRGMSMRGAKFLDRRPDFVLVDDLEEPEDVKDPVVRQATRSYFFGTFIPALDKPLETPIRLTGNLLDSDSLVARLEKAANWKTLRIPVEHIDPAGNRRATWPAKFPLGTVDAIRQNFEDQGLVDDYMKEYMCEAGDKTMRSFQESDIKVVTSHVHSWQRVDSFYDPARSTSRERSSHTGKVVFSWVGNKLIIWDGGGHFWMPDELIADIFATDDQFPLTECGVEQTGLKEWLMQPIRAEMTRRRRLINVQPYDAPRDKLSFIRGMQPFFRSGDVEFAQDLPVLKQQLLNFPTGRIDAPNALAYAYKMRPGQPVYPNFRGDCVTAEITPVRDVPVYLAVHANQYVTIGVLLQMVDNQLRIIADYMREGAPLNVLAGIVTDARLKSKFGLKLVAPASHFATYDVIGMRGAASRLPAELQQGGDPQRGREEISGMLGRVVGAQPGLVISLRASWTLRALAGGYAKRVDKAGRVTDPPDDDIYSIVMRAVESFAGLLRVEAAQGTTGGDQLNYAYTAGGQRFLSALPRRT